MITTRLRRILDWLLGLSLIGLGIVGLFLPVLQGVALIIAGLAVLSRHSRWAHWSIERLKSWVRALRDRALRRRRERGSGDLADSDR